MPTLYKGYCYPDANELLKAVNSSEGYPRALGNNDTSAFYLDSAVNAFPADPDSSTISTSVWGWDGTDLTFQFENTTAFPACDVPGYYNVQEFEYIHPTLATLLFLEGLALVSAAFVFRIARGAT